MDQPGQQLTQENERTWGPEARADCRLIKMVIVFSGGAQGVREKEGGEGRGGGGPSQIAAAIYVWLL